MLESLGGWVRRHPWQVGAIFATLIGMSAFDLYRFGVGVGEARAAYGDAARAASESLGG